MKQVVEFLTLLHENNDKAWFDSHKEMYKRALSCFEVFTAKLIDGIAAFDPSVRGLTVKDCTWRIYRDTRFSPDKTPYKTHMGAFVAPRGKKGGYSGYYFHVERTLLVAGASAHYGALLSAAGSAAQRAGRDPGQWRGN